MTTIELLAKDVRESWEGGTWAGSSLREAVEGVTVEQALARPLPKAHTIWELTVHAGAWADVVRRRIGGEAIHEPEEGDWIRSDTGDEAAWAGVLERLAQRQEALALAVEELDPAQLDALAGHGSGTIAVHAAGIADHNLYHAALIKVLRAGV